MGDLVRFGENLFVIEGPVVRDMGMPFDTRMTVAVLDDGSLWLESPVPVTYDTLMQLTALGPVKYLLTNTPRHVWLLPGVQPQGAKSFVEKALAWALV